MRYPMRDTVLNLREAERAVRDCNAHQIHVIVKTARGELVTDWHDVEDVVDGLKRGELFAWTNGLFNHDLMMLRDGILHYFGIERPKEEED